MANFPVKCADLKTFSSYLSDKRIVLSATLNFSPMPSISWRVIYWSWPTSMPSERTVSPSFSSHKWTITLC